MMDFSVQTYVQQFAHLTTCLASLDMITMAVRCLKLVYPSMVILILWNSSSIKFSKLFLFKPNTGPTGVDGTNCPGVCPTVCPYDDLICQGNVNDNGCDMPQFCLPSTGTAPFDSKMAI